MGTLGIIDLLRFFYLSISNSVRRLFIDGLYLVPNGGYTTKEG